MKHLNRILVGNRNLWVSFKTKYLSVWWMIISTLNIESCCLTCAIWHNQVLALAFNKTCFLVPYTFILHYYPVPNKRTHPNKRTAPHSKKFFKNVPTQINVPPDKPKGFPKFHTSPLKAYLLSNSYLVAILWRLNRSK